MKAGLVVGARVDRLDDADVPTGKRGLTVFQVVVPLADESIREALRANFLQDSVEVHMPFAQRARIAGTKVFQAMQVKVSGAVERLIYAADTEQEGTWKDVFLNAREGCF